VDPVVLAGDAASGLTVLRHDAVGREPDLDEALSLVGMYTANYGHWVFEKLFKLWACMDRPAFESVPVLIDQQMPAQMRQSLTAFLGDEHPVVVLAPGASVRVARLWVCPTIAYWPGIERLGTPTWPEQELSDVAALAPLVERANTRLRHLEEPRAGRRVLLARSDARLVNRAEVHDSFRNQGFDIVDPATLSFDEQVRSIRSADVIVTEDGSARYGLLFARPRARIGVLSVSGHEYEWLGAMLRELGHRLLLLAGAPVGDARNPTWSDYRIDVERLPAFIAELEPSS
jgi:capsular polysaccharide biosynthesis protein